MVNREVVLATVKKMVNSGIDDETIRQTLLGIGLSDDEISKVLAEARGKKVSEPMPDDPKAAERAVKAKLDLAREEQAMRDEQLHARMDEHNEKLNELHGEVRKISSMAGGSPRAQPAPAIPASIEGDIADLKAASKATQDLLKKILETNRQILFRLEQKK